jgi:ribosomal protein S18
MLKKTLNFCFKLRKINLLLEFLTKDGKILSRKDKNISTKKYRLISQYIRYSRNLKLLPFKEDIIIRYNH